MSIFECNYCNIYCLYMFIRKFYMNFTFLHFGLKELPIYEPQLIEIHFYFCHRYIKNNYFSFFKLTFEKEK